MIRPAAKIAIEVVAGVAAVAVLILAVAVWQLAQGPLPVNFLSPLVTQSINDQAQHYRVEIDNMVVAWAGADGLLELQAVDVSIIDKDDRDVVTVPRMAIDFNARAVLAGRLVPKTLTLRGASLALVRDLDGTMRLGLTNVVDEDSEVTPSAVEAAATREGDRLVARLLDAVSTPEEDGMEGLRLQGLSIRDAAVTVFDARSGGLWLASDVRLEFRNAPNGLSGIVEASVLSPGGQWRFTGTVRAQGRHEPVVVVAAIDNIKLPDFARTEAVLEPLSIIDSAVSGEVVAMLDRDALAIVDLSLDLTAGAGTLALPMHEPAPFYPPKPLGYDGEIQPEDPRPPYTPQPWTYDIEKARIKGRVALPGGALELEEFSVEGPAIDVAMSAQGEVAVDINRGIEDVALAVQVGRLAVNVPNVTTGLVRIDGFDGKLRYTPDERRLFVDHASVVLGEGYLALAGQIQGLSDGALGVTLSGDIDNLLLSDVQEIWPPRVAHGVLRWVNKNLSAGVLDTGRLRIDAPNGELGMRPIPQEAVDMTIDFADATARYLGALPPIQGGRGTMKITGTKFSATLTDGWIEPSAGGLIRLSEGSFTADAIQVRGSDARIEVAGAGSATAILALLDDEPLHYLRRFGLDPREVSGTGTVRITSVLPLRSKLRFNDITLSATGHASGLALPDFAPGVALDSGNVDFDVNNARLAAQGTMRVADTPVDLTWVEQFRPTGTSTSTFDIIGTFDDAARARLGVAFSTYVSGPIPVRATLKGKGQDIHTAVFDLDLEQASLAEPLIGWRKAPGVPARAAGNYQQADDGSMTFSDLTLSGDGVQLAGDAYFNGDGDLTRVSIGQLVLANGTDLAGHAERSPDDGVVRIEIEGSAFDARDFLDGLFQARPRDPQAEGAGATIIADANIGRVIAHEGEVLDDVSAHLLLEGPLMQELSVNGTFAEGGDLTIDLRPTPYGTRAIAAESENAGAFLRGINAYSNMQGGDVALVAEIDDRLEGAPLEGRLTGANMRIRDAPVLADILTLGSFTGINDTLQGEGILFTRLDASWRLDDMAFDLDDAIMAGPAIGVTIKGHINRTTDEVDLAGTIVPAYTVNSLLGNIPVVGDIFASREGEGLFGITYGISGPSNDPQVTVNPLAVLMPGILRRIFEFGGRSSEAAADATAAPRHSPENDRN